MPNAFLWNTPKAYGRLNPIDGGLLVLGVLVVAGVLLVQGGVHRTSSNAILDEVDVVFTVLSTNTRTTTPEMIQPGATTHLTVRNQPRGNVTILAAKATPHQVAFLGTNDEVLTQADPTLPHAYDYELQLQDHALETADGYVANGVKLKVGLPIILEGKTYRIPAVIAAVQPITPTGDAPAVAGP